MKKIISSILFYAIYILVLTEVAIRVFSMVSNIYDIEMIKYAGSLKQRIEHEHITHIHIPNSSDHLMSVDINLDENGHRVHNANNNASDQRIYLIGSSMSLGWGVQQDSTFAALLDNALDTVSITNAGIGNTNTRLYTEIYKMQGDAVEHDIVLLQYFLNDAEIIPKTSSNILYKYSYAFATLSQWGKILWYSMGKEKGSLADYYNKLYQDDAEGWMDAKASILELKDQLDQKGKKLVVLVLPDLHDLRTENNPYASIYSKIEDFTTENNISTINTFDAISKDFEGKEMEAWVANDDPHPNTAIHALIAKDLIDYFTAVDTVSVDSLDIQ